jgi:hypothetical protein
MVASLIGPLLQMRSMLYNVGWPDLAPVVEEDAAGLRCSYFERDEAGTPRTEGGDSLQYIITV